MTGRGERSKSVKRKITQLCEIDPLLSQYQGPASKRVKHVQKPSAQKQKEDDNAEHEEYEKYWKHIDSDGVDWDAAVLSLP
jgi:hypothetical protein